MSKITMEFPEELAAQLTTPEGMERARAAVLAAFGVVEQEPESDPRERQKQLDQNRDERMRTRAWRNEPA